MSRRRSQGCLGTILIIIVAVLWLLGMIPGKPSPLGIALLQSNTPAGPAANTPAQTATIGPAATPGLDTPAAAAPEFGVQTKTADCVSANALPDSACTPGAVFGDVTKDDVCVSGYSSKVRNVPDSEKNAVYAEYGVTHHTTGEYEVDHLVSLELGGSNDISNLWPEPANPTPGFHQKDEVENYLHDQVCNGSISLEQAQIEIATNWMTVYQSMPR